MFSNTLSENVPQLLCENMFNPITPGNLLDKCRLDSRYELKITSELIRYQQIFVTKMLFGSIPPNTFSESFHKSVRSQRHQRQARMGEILGYYLGYCTYRGQSSSRSYIS